ncbi:hypothetical protein ACFW1M_17495 [Streptomyces inhibens]|uniref:hypothetical protein n=1 Tax=Streptomyces inhibens TaxID=2293571 RepID=UPI0036859530
MGPASQSGDGAVGEAVGGEFLVVVPLGTGQMVAQVVEAECVASMAPAGLFEFWAGTVFGCGVDVDEVADGAAVGQGAGRGADDVIEGED